MAERRADTTSVQETCRRQAFAVAEQIETPTAQGSYKVHPQGLCEVVTDKGYHGGASLAAMQEWGVRTLRFVRQTECLRHMREKAG